MLYWRNRTDKNKLSMLIYARSLWYCCIISLLYGVEGRSKVKQVQGQPELLVFAGL